MSRLLVSLFGGHGAGEQDTAALPTSAGMLRRKADGQAASATGAAAAHFDSATAGASGEVPHRAEMERAFGEDFSGVQAYVGRAGEMQALHAQAAAQGERVAFADASPGPEVVAHELTHVVQDRRAGASAAPRTKDVSMPGDPAEEEADRVAADVVAGRPADVTAAPTAGMHRLASNDTYQQLAARGTLLTDLMNWNNVHSITYVTYQAEFPHLGAAYEALPADRDGLVVYCALSHFPNFNGHAPNGGTLNWIIGNPGPFVAALGLGFVAGPIMSYVAQLPQAQLEHFLGALDRSQAAMFIQKVVKNNDVPHNTMTNFTLAAQALLNPHHPPPAGLPTWSRALCMSLKYNIQFPLHGEVAPAPEADFNETALQQLEQTLDALPTEHVVDNAELRRIVREKDRTALMKVAREFGMTMGAYEDARREITLDYHQKGGKYVDRTSTRITAAPAKTQFAEANDPNAQTDSVFRFTLRHEVGHSVDKAIGGSGYTSTAAGGNWRSYNSFALAASEVFALAGDAHTVNAAGRLHLRGVAAQAFIEAVFVRYMTAKRDFRGQVRAEAAGHAALQPADIPYLVNELDASRAHEVLEKGKFASELGPWLNEGGWTDCNGRVFQQCYDNADGWASYQIGARDRKVSKYQFRSPGEWFAEAYSAFYEPSPPGQNLDPGYKLKGRDPVTWAWFRTRVHRDPIANLDAGTNTQSANTLMGIGNLADPAHGNPGGAATYDNKQAGQLHIHLLEQLTQLVEGGGVPAP